MFGRRDREDEFLMDWRDCMLSIAVTVISDRKNEYLLERVGDREYRQ